MKLHLVDPVPETVVGKQFGGKAICLPRQGLELSRADLCRSPTELVAGPLTAEGGYSSL